MYEFETLPSDAVHLLFNKVQTVHLCKAQKGERGESHLSIDAFTKSHSCSKKNLSMRTIAQDVMNTS